MIPLLAQTADSAMNIGLIVQGLSGLSTLALTVVLLVRNAGGKSDQRQIEPTEMHAMVTELKSQTVTLNNINRETGELKTQIKAVDSKIDVQSDQIENAFRRINAISTESAALKGRVDDMVAREGRRNA